MLLWMAEETAAKARAAILSLVTARGQGKTICPSEAARRIEPDAWRDLMPAVHQEARRLALEGAVTIYRSGAPVDPHTVKGVYRLGLAAGQD